MALLVNTRQGQIMREVINQFYQPKRICIISQDTVQEKAIQDLMNNVENYALTRTPVNIYNGAAEYQILYPLLSYCLDHYLNAKNYSPGSIARAIESRGSDLAMAVKALSLVNTKLGINSATDIAMGMMMASTSSEKPDFNLVTKDFLWNLINNTKERVEALNRILKSYVVPHYSKIDDEFIAHLTATITLGKGEVVPAEITSVHQAIRSLILVIAREMIDEAIRSRRYEIFGDVLPILALFIIYVNITENDQVYDQSFPVITSNGNNAIVHARRVNAFKTLSVIYNKVGFVGAAFDGDLTTTLLSEAFNLFPDLLSEKAYMEYAVDSSGNPTIDMSRVSFIQEASQRFDKAKEIFNSIMPTPFKGYVEKICKQTKEQTQSDMLLPSLFEDLNGKTKDGGAFIPLFNDLSPLYLGGANGQGGLEVIVESPEAAEKLPPTSLAYMKMRDFQKFLITHIFPSIATIYERAVSLRQAYDVVLQNIGTTGFQMVPGVNVELGAVDENIFSQVPPIDDATNYKYVAINEKYLYPTVFPAFLIDKDNKQIWTFSHLKYKFFRPDLLALRYARAGELIDLPKHLRLSIDPNASFNERWSWLNNALPKPTFMQSVSYAWTPIPYNYTADCVPDSMPNNGSTIDKFLTKVGKTPGLSYMTFGELLTEITLSGTIAQHDIALALAGLVFVYVKDDKDQWHMIDPKCPTIYGMPTILFRYVNEIDVSKSLVTVGNVTLPKDANDKQSDGYRILYDRSNRTQGINRVVFVLHKSVPTSRSLRYMLQTLRNGFVVKVPYLEFIFNQLFSVAKKSIKKQYDGLAKKKTGVSEENDQEFLLFALFNQVLTSFQTGPQGSETGMTAERFYDTFLSDSKIGLDKFIEQNFCDVKGWSNVITAFPHLTMTDRFVHLDSEHFNTWMRAFTSRMHVNAAEMTPYERLDVLTVTPNVVQQLTYDDEMRFIQNRSDSLIIDNLTERTLSYSERKNTTDPEDSVILGGSMAKHESMSEGSEMVMGDVPKNSPKDYVPETNLKRNVKPLITDQPVKSDKMLTEYEREVTKGNDATDIDQNKVRNKLVDKKVNNQQPTDEQVNDEGEKGSGNDPNLLATQIKLAPGEIEKNKKKITGDAIEENESTKNSPESEEEKKKKAKKGKKKDEEDEDETNLTD